MSSAYHGLNENEEAAIGTNQMVEGQWNHLAMVFNREEGKLLNYLNGRLVGEEIFQPDQKGVTPTSDWYVGGLPNLNKFHGWIDELRLYSSPMNDLKISKVYNWGSGDMGVTGKITAALITDDNPIPVSLHFTQYESPVSVQGLSLIHI